MKFLKLFSDIFTEYNYKKLSNSYGFESELDINEISVESVKNKIDKVLKWKKQYYMNLTLIRR